MRGSDMLLIIYVHPSLGKYVSMFNQFSVVLCNAYTWGTYQAMHSRSNKPHSLFLPAHVTAALTFTRYVFPEESL